MSIEIFKEHETFKCSSVWDRSCAVSVWHEFVSYVPRITTSKYREIQRLRKSRPHREYGFEKRDYTKEGEVLNRRFASKFEDHYGYKSTKDLLYIISSTCSGPLHIQGIQEYTPGDSEGQSLLISLYGGKTGSNPVSKIQILITEADNTESYSLRLLICEALFLHSFFSRRTFNVSNSTKIAEIMNWKGTL